MRSDSTPTLPTFRAVSAPRKTTSWVRTPISACLSLHPTASGIFCEAGEDTFGPIQFFRTIHQSKNGAALLFYAVIFTSGVSRLYHFSTTRVGERQLIRDEQPFFQPIYCTIAESVQNETIPAFPLFRRQPDPLRIPLEFSPHFKLIGSSDGLQLVNAKDTLKSYGPYPIIQSISIAENDLEIRIDPQCHIPIPF